MNISDILVAGAVRVIAGAGSKKRLFQEIGGVVSKTYGIEATECVDALNAREELGPTAVGNGIALPHARVAGSTQVCGVFCKLIHPLPFNAVDAQNVDLVFGLFAPQEAGVEHLKSLALVSRRLRSPRLREQLRANDDEGAIYALLIADDDIDGAQKVVNG